MLTTQQRSKFIQECLERTNEHRLRHGVGALKSNSQISSIAQEWADTLLRNNRMSHNPRARYMESSLGENVAYNFKSGSEVRGSEMIDQWYNEILDYNFNSHSSRKTTGHFTQLVWKNSKEVGFGLAASNGAHYLVANYFPPGNYVGQNKENVFPEQIGKNKVESRSKGAFGNVFKVDKSLPLTHDDSIKKPTLKNSNYQEINWNLRLDDNLLQQLNRNSPKVETRSHGDGMNKFPVEETSRGWNLSGKHGVKKESMGVDNLTNRLSAKLGLHSNDKKSDKDNSKNSFINCKPSSTLIVTETFYQPGSFRQNITTNNCIEQEVNLRDRTTIHQPLNSRATAFNTRTIAFNVTDLKPERTIRLTSDGFGQQHREQQTQQQFQDEVLSGHNRFRRRHQAPCLVINESISRMAQTWASELSKGNELKFSGNKYLGQQMGENLAFKYSSVPIDYLGSELVDNWYQEKDNYNFNYPNDRTNIDDIGHFTQMVWKGSKEIGIGKAWSRDGTKVFVVCNYFPVGNVLGCFRENVHA